MQQAERNTRAGKGFDQETHYVTYLFIKLLTKKEFNLFDYSKKNEIVVLKKIRLQTNDTLDDCYIEFEKNQKIFKACIDAKSGLTFSDINKNPENNNSTICQLISKITTSIKNNESYEFYIIPYTSNSSPQKNGHWDYFNNICRENEFDFFKNEFENLTKEKRAFIENFLKNFDITLEQCFTLFKKTCFFSTDLTSSNSGYVTNSIQTLNHHFNFSEDYKATCIYRLAHYFITNSKFTTNVDVNDFLNDAVVKRTLGNFKESVNLIQKKENEITVNSSLKDLINELKENRYNKNNLKDINDEINELGYYTKEEQRNFFNIIEKKSFIHSFTKDENIKRNCEAAIKKYQNKESISPPEFLEYIFEINKNNFPKWFDIDIVKSFISYLYYKNNDEIVDNNNFLNSSNYEIFLIILNKLRINKETFEDRKDELTPLLTWLSLLSMEKYIYISDSSIIIPSIFRSFKLSNTLDLKEIITDFENIVSNISKLQYELQEYLFNIDFNNDYTVNLNSIEERKEKILETLYNKEILKKANLGTKKFNSSIKIEDIKETIKNIQERMIEDYSWYYPEIFLLIIKGYNKKSFATPQNILNEEDVTKLKKLENNSLILNLFLPLKKINSEERNTHFLIKKERYKFIFPLSKEMLKDNIKIYFISLFEGLSKKELTNYLLFLEDINEKNKTENLNENGFVSTNNNFTELIKIFKEFEALIDSNVVEEIKEQLKYQIDQDHSFDLSGFTSIADNILK